MLQVHVHNQHDFLAEVVKGDDLVEEHQVHILEPLRVFGLPFGRRLPVSQVIIGKIPYQTSCERRQIIESRTFVISQNLPQIRGWIVSVKSQASHLHFSVQTGDFQLGVIAQEGVPPPLLPPVHGFQDIAVGGYVLQFFEGLNRGAQVGEQLAAHRQDLAAPGLRDGPDLFQAWSYVHNGSFPSQRQ